jgi:hypothetical protein
LPRTWGSPRLVLGCVGVEVVTVGLVVVVPRYYRCEGECGYQGQTWAVCQGDMVWTCHACIALARAAGYVVRLRERLPRTA